MGRNLFSVKDKVVFITGGDANIGKALSKGFATDGAKVVVGNPNRASAEEIIRWFEEGGYDYLWVPLDVSSEEQVKNAFDAILGKYGRLDVMINNAGMRVNETALEHGAPEWDRIFAVNVKGTMLCAQAAARIMKEQGGGKIINTSSISAIRGMEMRSSYCSTKGAVDAYTKAAAVEWARYGIYVNAVGWGGVDITETPIPEMSEGMKKSLAMIPLKKMADSDMLYGACAFLASDASNGVTGQTLMADGGWSVMGKPQNL